MLHRYTCRAVPLHNTFVNGKVGRPFSTVNSQQQLDFLNAAHFNYLDGTAVLATEPPIETKPWCFRRGEKLAVSQWLVGIGKTEQDDPEGQLQDMPRDARKMMITDRSPILGRVRVAKGTSLFPAETDSAEIDCDKNWEGEKVVGSLDYIMRRKPGGDSESEHSDSASTSDSNAHTTGPTFASLMQWNETDNKSSYLQQASQSVERNSSVQHFNGQSSRFMSSSRNLEARSASMMSIKKFDTLPSFGREFAIVDAIGLTANAASQAKWDLDHHELRSKAPRNKSQSALLQSQTPDSSLAPTYSAPMNLSRGTELYHPRLEPRPTSPAVTLETTTEVLEPWARQIIPMHTTSVKLIDDSLSISTTHNVTCPPGMDLSASGEVAIQRQITDAGGLGDLIDFGEDDEMPMPNKPGKFNPQTLPPFRPISIVDHGRISAQSTKKDENIIEKVQEVVDVQWSKRFTMRQKAQKKKKKSRPKPKAPGKVQLELPEPLPPPKTAVRDATAQSSGPPSQEINIGVFHRQIDATNCEKWSDYIADVRQRHPEAYLEVQFGLILSHVQDRKGKMSLGQLMDKLIAGIERKSFFNTRLTTSIGDVFYVLSLANDGEVQESKTIYEFSIQDIHRLQSRVTISSDAKKIIAVKNEETVLGIAHIHFPLRVWDARATFSKSGQLEVFGDFLPSLRTDGEPPAFTANVHTSLFEIEKAYAQRQYTRPIRGTSAKLVVTEVQELALEPLNEAYANLRASLSSRDTMIEEQRLWWEAKIVCEDIAQAEGIYELVERFVTQIDSVGLENRGPKIRREPSEPKPKAEVPFW
ncbi:hypothetical protein M433DRAFT_150719 [Acidomyces richmondensis BFW]|nr:MAG: hypothetical protein FE78DRAFT_83965 [Acidomyces sp. 'richmondensis']KYG48778.1 hypothetical protein M433DRAFT_150719 [Acidomyces richmondensis BFW]